jgi:hypothetical protein
MFEEGIDVLLFYFLLKFGVIIMPVKLQTSNSKSPVCPTKLTDTPINHRILLNPCNVMNITSPCPRCRQQGLVVAMLSVGSWYAGTPCALILNREFVHPSSHIYNYSTPHSFQIFSPCLHIMGPSNTRKHANHTNIQPKNAATTTSNPPPTHQRPQVPAQGEF